MQVTSVIYGSGAYGIVYEAIDAQNCKFAIKCNLIDLNVNFIGTIRELDIINRLHGHPNIVYTNYIYFKNPFSQTLQIKTDMPNVKCDSIYFVFKPAKNNILNNIHNITYSEIKKYMLDILLGLEFMHSKNIIHQDIKPANILISDDGSAQLCDFGLSEPVGPNIKHTEGVITIWYRPPEIILEKAHSLNADIWSVACVILEMFTKRAILENCPDKNSEALKHILSRIPVTDREEFINTLSNKNLKNIKPRFENFQSLLKLTKFQIDDFNNTPGTFDQFIDLISGMLLCNPKTRFNATTALNHDFFASSRNRISEFRHKYQKPEINCLSILSSEIRRKIMKLALYYFDKNSLLIPPKVIFSSISLFDRYISWSNDNPIHPVSGLILPDLYEDAVLKYYVCLYIFIKYFVVIHSAPGFDVLVADKYKNIYPLIDNFERRLIRDVCKSKVYVPTVLEYVNNLNLIDLRKLLLKYMESGTVTNVDTKEYAKLLSRDL
jgi:serine/threonine protein kinase